MLRRKEKPERNRLDNARLKKGSIFPKSARLRRPSDTQEAKEWLRGVADHLSNFPNAGPPFRFVAYAIKHFLRRSRGLPDAKAQGLLFRSLQLANPKGRPTSFKTRMRERERARKIIALKHEKTPWHQIGQEVGLEDKRSLKRLYDKYIEIFAKEKALEQIDRKMKEFFHERGEETRLHSPSS